MAWSQIGDLTAPAGSTRQLWVGDEEPADWNTGDYWLRTSGGVVVDVNVCTSEVVDEFDRQ